jgi:GNAT superfamily N-acetyltransferase
MQYKIVPFTQDYLEPAVNLFINNYKNEREKNPLLPLRAINEPEWIFNSLKSLMDNTGVAVLESDRVIAYMVTGFLFSFKGQNAVLVPEYCHGSVLKDKKELYQRMYMQLAEGWAKSRRHIHIVGHFTHDIVLRETLYQLGFGAIVAERVRDFSEVTGLPVVDIVEEKDFEKLIDIEIEHLSYYPNAPIFIWKDTERKAIISGLESHSNNGDAFLVYYEQDKPCAYVIVGTSAIGAEGFLLQNTSTAQIKSAYAQPHVRGKGIGKALLQSAFRWSQEHGYERVFVEHETANYYGGNFWCKQFNPYVYFSLRYIDNTIDY